MKTLVDRARELFNDLDLISDIGELVETINTLRELLHDHSPFADEPVDLVVWQPADKVQANDYNPNAVAPPEMELLRLSILADGFTQPIVTHSENGHLMVVDGFHRNRVGKEYEDVTDRVHGFLPVVKIRDDRTDRGDRIAATIRHNRARGKHLVEGMSDIVIELKRRNWSDNRIGKELGMEPDEVLRLTQISGLTEMFADRDFSEAWEHWGGPAEQPPDEEEGSVDLEWMNDLIVSRDPGWDDRTPNNSVLNGEHGQRLGNVQRSRFRDNEWFWYAYTAPMNRGSAPTLEEAKMVVESMFL